MPSQHSNVVSMARRVVVGATALLFFIIRELTLPV
jgi:hypothetical protein